MKICITFLLTVLAGIVPIAFLPAQKIEGVKYVIDYGLQPRIEKSWHMTRVSQNISFKETPEGITRRFDFNIHWYAAVKLSAFKIQVMNSAGAVVDEPKPGTPPASLPAGLYGAMITGTYADGFGEISFKLSGLEIKDPPPPAPGKPLQSSLTSVRLDFNFPQVKVRKSPAKLGGKTRWDLATYWAPGRKDGGYVGRPILLQAGTQNRIQGIEGADWWGTYKPGVYDLLLNADISRAGKPFDVRRTGIKLVADTRYDIDYVLNGGAVIVKGPNVPHVIHFYKPGTADKVGPVKSWTPYPPNQTWSIEGPGFAGCCPPGIYDILYNYGHGARYDWRKNVDIKVGDLVELK